MNLLRAIWKNKSFIFTIILISVVFSAVYVFRLPDEYTAVARIFAEKLPTVTAKADEKISLDLAMFDPYRAVFTTYAIAKDVYEKKTPKPPSITNIDEFRIFLIKNLIVKKDDQIYSLAVTYTDPIYATKLVNDLASAFVKESLKESIQLPPEMYDLFAARGADLKKFTSEERLKALSDINQINDLPSIRADSEIRTLTEQKFTIESQLAELSKRYREKHPKMLQLRKSLDLIDNQIQARKDVIVEATKEKLVEKLQQTKTVRVLEEASIPKNPTGPDRLRIVTWAGGCGFVFSLLLVILYSLVDKRVNSVEDFSNRIQLPYIGNLPKISKSKKPSNLYLQVKTNPDSDIAEGFSQLAANIEFATSIENRKSLLITSAREGEGKTFIAVNLALLFASKNLNVLLVDANLRSPKLHEIFQMENKAGLSNVLASFTSGNTVIRKTFVDHLDLISTGTSSPNPSELFGSKAMGTFLDEVEKSYDVVIFDGSSAYRTPETAILGARIKSTLLVVQAHHTSHQMIVRTKNLLLNKNVRMVGGILNRFKYSEISKIISGL